MKRQKRKDFNVHVIRTLSFFRGKSDVFKMRKRKNFTKLGPSNMRVLIS